MVALVRECGLEMKRHRAHALAVMTRIAAHASSDGSGIAFNPEVWTSLADEIGLAPEEGKAAVDFLDRRGPSHCSWPTDARSARGARGALVTGQRN